MAIHDIWYTAHPSVSKNTSLIFFTKSLTIFQNLTKLLHRINIYILLARSARLHEVFTLGRSVNPVAEGNSFHTLTYMLMGSHSSRSCWSLIYHADNTLLTK